MKRNTRSGRLAAGFVARGLAIATVGLALCAEASVYRVAPDAAGGGDGQSWSSTMTLKEAITAAANDDVILCQAGDYAAVAGSGNPSSSFAVAKPLTIRGGLKGTDDVTLDETSPVSAFTAPAQRVHLFYVTSTTGTNVFENLKLAGIISNHPSYLYSAITKSGAGSIDVRNCQIVNNAGGHYCGYATGFNFTGAADSTAVISNCLFAGHYGIFATGAGQALRLNTFKVVDLEGCTFATNGINLARGGRNLSSSGNISGSAFYAVNAPIRAKGCTFIANRSAWLNDSDAGCVILAGNGGDTSFENCTWVGNSEIFNAILNASYGYTATSARYGGALVANFSSNDSTLTLKNCTVAMNQTDSPSCAAGVTVVKGKLKVIDSIIANNIIPGYAAAPADLMVAGAAEVTLSNVQFTANGPSSFVLGVQADTPPSGAGLRFGDPLFNTALSDITSCLTTDNSWTYTHPFFTTASGPTLMAIDCGLTSASPALGLGAKTATDPAIPTGTPSFGSVALAFPDGYTDPRVTVTMAGDDDYLATLAVTIRVGGVAKATRTFCGVKPGDVRTFAPPLGLAAGDAVSVEATATVTGVSPVTDTSASGTVPSEATPAPWIDVAGAANVIYVREGADGAGTGLSWADALTSVEAAFASLTADRNEIWIAGDFAMGAGIRHTTPASSFAVRGGFAGGESAASERPQDGSRAVLDFTATKSGITVANGAGITATFERIEFLNAREGAIVKSGAGDIEVANCRFLGCSDDATCYAGRAYGGTALRLTGTTAAHASVTGCVFEGCMSYRDKYASYTRGQVLNVTTLGKLELTDCLFLTNGIPWSPYRNNMNNIGLAFSIAYVSGATSQVTRCRFIGNRFATRSEDVAGCFYLTGASGGSAFENCLWTANAASWTEVNNPGALSSTASLVVSLANATDEVDVNNCTLAYNLVDGNKGSGGASIVKGKANIRNSIFYGNARQTGGTGGNDLALQANGSAEIAYSLFTAPTGTYDSITFVTGGSLTIDDATTLYVGDGYDPQFVTPLATAQGYFTTTRNGCRCFKEADKAEVCDFDLHIKSPAGYRLNDGTWVADPDAPTSAALDAGDPDSDYSAEPSPNGKRVNMGAYGNTASASKTATVALSIEDVRTTYPTEWSRPHIEVDMGGSSGYSAIVTISCYTGGVLVVSRSFPNRVFGDTVSWDPAVYLAPGDELDVRVVATAKGAEEAQGPACKTTVEGALPPWSGKGGGNGILHVREGADGDATGLNWTDAYPTLEAVTNRFVLGELPASYREIWLAGAFTRGGTMATVVPKASLAVRGGFDGHENAAAERTNAAARATIDGVLTYPCLEFNHGVAATVTVDRIAFVRGTDFGLRKQGSGDIVVRDCRFANNRRIHPWSNTVHLGRGSGADLVGTAGTTLAVISNCVFEGNSYSSSGCDCGGGVYLSGLRQATISDCLFLTNGIPWGVTVLPYTGFSSGQRGAAFYAGNVPVVVSNCRFIGNRPGPTGNSVPGGGTVVLAGACDGSSFDHCLWTGNEDAWTGYYQSACASTSDSGALMVMLGDSSQTVDVKNCTIAYNYADRGLAGAGVTVSMGTVNIVDSILYGNFGGTKTKTTVGRDLTLTTSNAYANVRYTLLGTPDGLSASSVDPANLVTNASDGVLFADPRFVTTYASVTNLIVSQGADRHSDTKHHRFSDAARDLVMSFDVHVRGRQGYVDEKTGASVYWRGERSPAIDAGDPASDHSREAQPNGRRANLGVYGNTPHATRSGGGVRLLAR